MASPLDTADTFKMTIADSHRRAQRTPPSMSRPIDILNSLAPGIPPTATPSVRPIDILNSLRLGDASTSVESTFTAHSAQNRRRPIDILADLQDRPSSSSISVERNSLTQARHARPIDILSSLRTPGSIPPIPDYTATHSRHHSPCHSSVPLSSSPIAQHLRPIAPLPKRAIHKSASVSNVGPLHPVHPVPPTLESPAVPEPHYQDVDMDAPSFLDLTQHPSADPDIIELTDTSESDIDMTTPLDKLEDEADMRSRAYVFNTNLPPNPRCTIRPWAGSLRPQDWIPSREELHAEQVDFDRALPSDINKSGYPLYAISPSDMESMHRFLMARYQVSTFEDYKHLLALLRNTRAIAAHKARSRHLDIQRLQDYVAAARNHLIQQLRDGRTVL